MTRNMFFITLLSSLFFCSCSLIKNDPKDELETLGQDVIKSRTGLDIRIEPIQEPKK